MNARAVLYSFFVRQNVLQKAVSDYCTECLSRAELFRDYARRFSEGVVSCLIRTQCDQLKEYSRTSDSSRLASTLVHLSYISECLEDTEMARWTCSCLGNVVRNQRQQLKLYWLLGCSRQGHTEFTCCGLHQKARVRGDKYTVQDKTSRGSGFKIPNTMLAPGLETRNYKQIQTPELEKRTGVCKVCTTLILWKTAGPQWAATESSQN